MVKKLILLPTVISVFGVTTVIAKPHRTKEVHTRTHLVQNTEGLTGSYCRFRYGETDPDPRIKFQLIRDCRHDEYSE